MTASMKQRKPFSKGNSSVTISLVIKRRAKMLSKNAFRRRVGVSPPVERGFPVLLVQTFQNMMLV
jgi:hypothetical protein